MIKSRSNSRLKDIRRARKSKGAEAVLEGPHLVAEALDAGIELRNVLATPDFLEQEPGRALLSELRYPPHLIAPNLLAETTDSDSPRGIVAIADLPRFGVDRLPRRRQGIYLFVDGVQDPGNLGALARVAEASGATALCAGPGTAHPNHARALRASAGSLLRLRVAVGVEPRVLSDHLASVEPIWLALATRGGRDLYQPHPEGCLVVAVGAEKGLSTSVRERADVELTISLQPPVESLNTTVAAALVLFEIQRQRGAC